MKIPSQWSDVTLEQFIEIALIDKSQGATNYNSEVISILIDEDVDDLDIDELKKIIASFKWSESEPSKKYKHELLGMTIKPFNKLCLYEYIDLDHFFTDNYISNLDKVCAILYRKSKVNEWGEVVLEPYDYDCHNRADKFSDLPITDVYGIIKDFIKFRDKFLSNYHTLFTEPDNTINEDEPEDVDDAKATKWSWERTIYTLCNGDITKYEAVGGLPLTQVFNTIAMKKELDL